MPIMIQLQPEYGEPVWINAQQIISMERIRYGSTEVTEILIPECPRKHWHVKETPEEIHMMIEQEIVNLNCCMTLRRTT